LKIFSLILVFALLAGNIVTVKSVSSDEVSSELVRAFVDVQNAERSGADIRPLVRDLNVAILLLKSGGEENVTKASFLVTQVRTSAAVLLSQAIQNNYIFSIFTLVSLVILGVLGLIVWFYGSRLYWYVWLRLYSGWRVERS
jgi:hypothetical protein